jgi:hypothetical protein
MTIFQEAPLGFPPKLPARCFEMLPDQKMVKPLPGIAFCIASLITGCVRKSSSAGAIPNDFQLR